MSSWGLLCAGLSALAYAAMVIFNKIFAGIIGAVLIIGGALIGEGGFRKHPQRKKT